MEQLITKIADLISKAENSNLIPSGCTFELKPEGCKIISSEGVVLFDNY